MKMRMGLWMHDGAMRMVLNYALLWALMLLGAAGYAQARSAHADRAVFHLETPSKIL
jgi:hypothetical protein